MNKEEKTVIGEFEGAATGEATVYSGGDFTAVIKLSKCVLWDIGKGNLYDVTLTFGEDAVHSYFGIRTANLCGMKFMLNNKSVFQRLVLDRGYYEDGIYTAPTEQDMVNDIKISMDMGFNGARLHEKVFEPRFLYHCDKMGYMVWGEYPNWGCDIRVDNITPLFIREWIEAVRRDINHPSIVVWCILCHFGHGMKNLIQSTWAIIKIHVSDFGSL